MESEWGFDGVVTSDWSAARSTAATALAALDLAMPGPGGPWGEQLAGAVRDGLVAEEVLDDKLMRLLRLARQVGALAGPELADVGPAVRLIDPALLRRATAASFVLLGNADQALPIDSKRITKLAVTGPGALRPAIQGGGSVAVAPSSVSAPAAALAWWDGLPPGIGWGESGAVVLDTLYRPDVTGAHLVGAAGVGRLTITVDGQVVADGLTATPADPVQAMTKPGQVRAGIDMQAGQQIRLSVHFRPAADGDGPLAIRFGVVPAADDEELLTAAQVAAQDADAAIVVVGSADLTECEGFDRTTLALPGRQDELVGRIAAVNARTIVVVNSGMPVLMPWADQVAAVLQVWLPGQAVGDALADVLFGDSEPGGRRTGRVRGGAAAHPGARVRPLGRGARPLDVAAWPVHRPGRPIIARPAPLTPPLATARACSCP